MIVDNKKICKIISQLHLNMSKSQKFPRVDKPSWETEREREREQNIFKRHSCRKLLIICISVLAESSLKKESAHYDVSVLIISRSDEIIFKKFLQ
jgi:hypothetical protein